MKLRDVIPITILIVMLVVGFAGFFVGKKDGARQARVDLVTGQEICKPKGVSEGEVQVECKSRSEIMSVLEFIGGNNVKEKWQ